jgi:hypothetical protein
MGVMRISFALVLGLIAALSGACAHRGRGPRFAGPTGTCVGACDYYLWCKAQRGEDVSERDRSACELECPEVFSGAEPLAAFESLTCEDAIAFVEGDSGRGPGAVPASAQRVEPSADTSTSEQRTSKSPAAHAP